MCICWLIVEVILRSGRCNDENQRKLVFSSQRPEYSRSPRSVLFYSYLQVLHRRKGADLGGEGQDADHLPPSSAKVKNEWT